MGLEQQVKILNTIKRLNAQDFVRLIKLRNINPKKAQTLFALTQQLAEDENLKASLGLLPWKSLIGLYATPQEAEYKSLAKDMLLLDSDTQTISDHSRSVLDSLMSEFDSLSKCADDYTQQAIQNAHSSTSLCIHILKVIDAVKISVKGRGMKPKVGTIDIKKMSTHFHVDSKTIDIACCCICDCKLAIPGRTSWELADNIPPLLKKDVFSIWKIIVSRWFESLNLIKVRALQNIIKTSTHQGSCEASQTTKPDKNSFDQSLTSKLDIESLVKEALFFGLLYGTPVKGLHLTKLGSLVLQNKIDECQELFRQHRSHLTVSTYPHPSSYIPSASTRTPVERHNNIKAQQDERTLVSEQTAKLLALEAQNSYSVHPDPQVVEQIDTLEIARRLGKTVSIKLKDANQAPIIATPIAVSPSRLRIAHNQIEKVIPLSAIESVEYTYTVNKI